MFKRTLTIPFFHKRKTPCSSKQHLAWFQQIMNQAPLTCFAIALHCTTFLYDSWKICVLTSIFIVCSHKIQWMMFNKNTHYAIFSQKLFTFEKIHIFWSRASFKQVHRTRLLRHPMPTQYHYTTLYRIVVCSRKICVHISNFIVCSHKIQWMMFN